MKNYIPILIRDVTTFSVFIGLLKGTLELIVSDNGSDVFTAMARIKRHKKVESTIFLLSGNQSINVKCCGVSIVFSFTKWQSSSKEVSFHVYAFLQKGIISKTVFDKIILAERL